MYCENKCGARMMRRLLSQHTLAECPKRTQPCTYCAKEFVFDTIQVRRGPWGRGRPDGSRCHHLTAALCPQNHQYQCPRYPVPCPNQCGTPSIAREDMPSHLKESCNTAMLLCPFKEAGCKHRVSLAPAPCQHPHPHPIPVSLHHQVPRSIPTALLP